MRIPIDYVTIGHNHLQQSVPWSFLLFKRCGWGPIVTYLIDTDSLLFIVDSTHFKKFSRFLLWRSSHGKSQIENLGRNNLQSSKYYIYIRMRFRISSSSSRFQIVQVSFKKLIQKFSCGEALYSLEYPYQI